MLQSLNVSLYGLLLNLRQLDLPFSKILMFSGCPGIFMWKREMVVKAVEGQIKQAWEEY